MPLGKVRIGIVCAGYAWNVHAENLAVDEVEAYKSIELVEACYGSVRMGGR